jgi:hypothetical protein
MIIGSPAESAKQEFDRLDLLAGGRHRRAPSTPIADKPVRNLG